MYVNLETLSNVIQVEKEIRSLLGEDAYVNRKALVDRILDMTTKEEGEFYVLLNTLKDNCRVLRACGIEAVSDVESK